MKKLAVLFALLVPATSFAQPNLADDRADRGSIHALVASWNAAVARRDRAAELAADAAIRAWLNAELAEDSREVGQANAEVARSRAERNRSRAERNRSRTLDDRRDLRDDRRDLRDDRRDRNVASHDLAVTREISARLAAMQPSFAAGTATSAQYAQKRALLHRLTVNARAEVRQSRREVREDGRELREDRRERRELH